MRERRVAVCVQCESRRESGETHWRACQIISCITPYQFKSNALQYAFSQRRYTEWYQQERTRRRRCSEGTAPTPSPCADGAVPIGENIHNTKHTVPSFSSRCFMWRREAAAAHGIALFAPQNEREKKSCPREELCAAAWRRATTAPEFSRPKLSINKTFYFSTTKWQNLHI